MENLTIFNNWLCREMLFQLEADNNAAKWVLRIAGWLMTWLGMQMFLGPLAVLPDVVPCIGPILGDMVGFALCCCTCGSSFTIATVVFAVAWLGVCKFLSSCRLPTAYILTVLCCHGTS